MLSQVTPLTSVFSIELSWSLLEEDLNRKSLFHAKHRPVASKVDAQTLLKDSKRRMEAELHRMDDVQQGLVSISQNLRTTEKMLNVYNTELVKAKKYVKDILLQ